MNKIISAFAAALCATLLITSYSDGVQADLRDNLIRLHIIADSDFAADQNVKLKVRDAILKNVGEKLSDGNREDCKEEIINNLSEIEKIADSVLAENGFTYKSHAQYGKFNFPEKSYKSLTLPAGEYYGVRVVLGSGGGHNWWCVMYPPLCVTDGGEAGLSEEGERLLREKLNEDTYDIVTGNGDDIVIKFKIVEMVQELKQKINRR